jgi:hypothetical protein
MGRVGQTHKKQIGQIDYVFVIGSQRHQARVDSPVETAVIS